MCYKDLPHPTHCQCYYCDKYRKNKPFVLVARICFGVLLVIFALIFLMGCNADGNYSDPGYRRVTFHQVDTREQLRVISQDYETENQDGWAEWDDYDCDIYLLHSREYFNKAQYELVVNHELRHCAEGHFH